MWLPAVLAIAMAVFLAGYVLDQRKERLRNDLLADFTYESRELALRVASQFIGYRQILRGSRALMTVIGNVQQDQWSSYAGNLFLANDYPGLEVLGYAHQVLPDRLDVHEERVRRSAFPDYRVAPRGDGAAPLAPVARLDSADDANRELVGFNLASNPALQQALASSARTGKAALSAPVGNLLPGPDAPASRVFLFLPLYKADFVAPKDPAQAEAMRQEHISGWVFGAFRVDRMLRRTLEPLPHNTRLQVFAGRVIDPRQQLYDSAPHSSKSATLASHTDQELLQVVVPLELEGQNWSLVFEGFPRAYSQEQGVASADLTAVLLICLLFGASAILATISRLRALRLAQLAQELQQSNARYEFLATHDALTQVANRVLFQRTLDAQVANSLRYGHAFAVIYIDLDKFKQVNDRLGHEAGDQVLIEATRRLSALLRATDLVARRGGDEFVVLLPQITDLAQVTHVADKICAALAEPIPLTGGATGSIAGSLGIALFPVDGKDSETLVQTADHRMYRAKQRGGNCWIAYDNP